jgi:putative acetyltransferase
LLTKDLSIRLSCPADRGALLLLWERSVRATHDFLTEADIDFFRPLVGQYFESSTDIWVLADMADVPIGFLGLDGNSIAALFMAPAYFGKGGGRRMVSHAQKLRGGVLTVDVNEQNAAARGFYEALGFSVVDRSPLDDNGRPFPILHMRRGNHGRL